MCVCVCVYSLFCVLSFDKARDLADKLMRMNANNSVRACACVCVCVCVCACECVCCLFLCSGYFVFCRHAKAHNLGW